VAQTTTALNTVRDGAQTVVDQAGTAITNAWSQFESLFKH